MVRQAKVKSRESSPNRQTVPRVSAGKNQKSSEQAKSKITRKTSKSTGNHWKELELDTHSMKMN